MEPLKIERTKTTPSVILDREKGIFEISGNSLPENAMGFYQPVVDWCNDYLTNANPSTEFNFKLDYFNTASSKILFELIKLHKSLLDSGKSIQINWYYHEEDEDMLEAGQDYADLTKLPFEFLILT
jgi:hypothetical protein